MKKLYFSFLSIFILFFCGNIFSNTYTVSNTSNSGAGSLRQAILDANSNAGADIITFTTSGTVTLLSALPALSGSGGVTINGNAATSYVANTNATWPGSLNGTLTFCINGNSLYAPGLSVTSDNNIIRGLSFINIGTAGASTDVVIDIASGADNNQVLGCYLGTTMAGTASAGANTEYGVRITGAANNQIGNGTAAGRNLISGMADTRWGIYITGASATGNTIEGNIIGLQKDGATYIASAQQYGVYITTDAASNTIGGSAAGEGNVISGNTNAAIYLISTGTGGNSILGNYLGPQANGTSIVASADQDWGILLESSPNNTIGGSTAGARNIISGNVGAGIYFLYSGTTGNVVKGNYIGLDKNGTTFIASSAQPYGIYFLTFGTSAESNTIGGTAAGEGNVISGNTGMGIYFGATGGAGNTVVGNIIGPQANGTSYVASNAQAYGVYITGSPNNTIGGNTAGARNIISANETYGIQISGASATGNVIKGNYIGLDQTGTTFIASSSQDYGINIPSLAGSNTIGGTGAGEGNVISGNTVEGIRTNSAAGNSFFGNIIGPQANGSSNVTSNAQTYGIRISGSPNNIVGGTTAGARNIISANLDYGIQILSAAATGNVIKGNYIGLDITGTTFITGSSQNYGIDIGWVFSGATGNTIGGTAAGEGNVISGNSVAGVYFSSPAAVGNSVLGNIIGPQANGTSNVTSNAQNYGIQIGDAFSVYSRNNTIGDGTVAGRNIISANLLAGVYIYDAGSTGNVIKGNYIGLDQTGTTFITGSTQDYGVQFTVSSASNTIGGTAAGEGNVISGNSVAGVYLTSTAVAGNTVVGNIIGPQADGTTYVASNPQTTGVYISGSRNNTIGGNSAGARNIISANETYGVYITGSTSAGNLVKGNYIGLDQNGTTFITGSTQDNGVYITSSATGNTIGGTSAGEANVISGNSYAGVYSNSASSGGNTFIANIIGPRVNGTTYVTSNVQSYGIYVDASTNNSIGGNSSASRNIISANEDYGVFITGAGSTGNVVEGNYIGLDINGTTYITGSTQNYGVFVAATTLSNTIGGTGAGEGNVISGTSNIGIYLSSAAGVSVLGNIIGPQANGTTNVTSNAQSMGIYINNSPDNTIGGSTSASRNIISANTTYGIAISGAASTGNSITGNYIGIDINGTTFIASSSQDYGVNIGTSAASNTIGGSGAGEGNVISGNTFAGVYTNSTGSAGNTILGNIIGPQSNGTTYLTTNQTYGIQLSGSPNNTVGGNSSGARNIISANTTYGVHMTGAGSTGNTIKGNYIGIDQNGTTFIASSSQDYGVYMTSSAASNTIGGSGAGEGNVISANISYGVFSNSTAAAGNTILGNIIGPQANGTSNEASLSQDYGVALSGSPNNTVGGNSSATRNIISGNALYGVYLLGAGSTGNTIKGNYLGIDQNGTTFIASSSQDYGVYITSSAGSNTIGGTGAGEGNVISGNVTRGLFSNSGAAAGNTIVGNIIGPQANGTSYVASNVQDVGIWLQGTTAHTVGGSSSGARNILSGNVTSGIRLDAGATSNTVKGNYIGIDQNGTTFISGSNQLYGVFCSTSSSGNTFGGTGAGEGNVISGNTTRGVYLTTTGATGNTFLGNIIGPQADGVSYVAANSQDDGIYISSSPGNTIGGSAAGSRNIISANENSGVTITGATSTGNVIKGNYVGPGSSLASVGSSSQDYGIYLTTSAASTTIGGSVAGDPNTIAYNTANGIYLTGASTDYNKISQNPIYSNIGKPINLNYSGGSNNNKAIPVITTATTATVIGTSDPGDVIELFKNTTGDCNDATTFVNSATADGSGNWSMTGSLSNGDFLLATARDASNNTSEFTLCTWPLPVQLLSFTAACKKGEVELEWITASEINNDYFTVERTQDQVSYRLIGIVKGVPGGYSSTKQYYSLKDTDPVEGTAYYRLKQTDFNGQHEYFPLVGVNCGTGEDVISIHPNPAIGEANITIKSSESTDVKINLIDVLGRKVLSRSAYAREGTTTIALNLYGISSGSYMLEVTTQSGLYLAQKQLMVR